MKQKLLLLSILFMVAQGTCLANRKPILLTVCNDDGTAHGNPDDRNLNNMSLYIDGHTLYLPEEFTFNGIVTIELWGRKGMAYNNSISATTRSQELPSALVGIYNIVIIYNDTTYIGNICL